MPEGLEAEIYRRSIERCVGRTIEDVEIDDRQPESAVFPDALAGREVVAARRHGKLVIVDLAPDEGRAIDSFGLHFGMTGRVVVDGEAPIDELEYGSRRDDPAWDRLVVRFEAGGTLRVNDPRRWARFTLAPDVGRLGPDFLAVEPDWLFVQFSRRRAPVKSVLLDQSLVAGYGNLCVDELLWQLGISPHTPARDVPERVVGGFGRPARQLLDEMLRAGGSHRGVIDPDVRSAVPPCPRDGAPMLREQVGGRTTVWCRQHQIAFGA